MESPLKQPLLRQFDALDRKMAVLVALSQAISASGEENLSSDVKIGLSIAVDELHDQHKAVWNDLQTLLSTNAA